MTSIGKRITSSLLVAFTFVGGMLSIASCNKNTFVDYTHNGSVKLLLDYKNHDFFEDGIGQVTVKTYIDGDTTHFNNVYGDTTTLLKARYYGIDTPESTGNIQPWGKKASNFTHEKLLNAATNGTIVVSSPFSTDSEGKEGYYGKPETDSTGGRYLSLVWINETVKNAPVDSLVLLNLWLVQEGLSWAKNTTEVPAYAPTFAQAKDQAEKNKLRIWSDEEDPDFNYGGYETVSLLDIKHENEEYIRDPSYVNKYAGMNVRFTGTVAGYSDHNLYVQEFYPDDPDDPTGPGEYAGINIFCGMSAISSIYTVVGTYLEVVGKAVNSDTFGFQISDTQGHWPASGHGGDTDCKVLLTAEENKGVHQLKTFKYTAEQLANNIENENFENLFCRTEITEDLICNRAYVNDAADELTVYFEGVKSFNGYLPFVYKGNPDDSGDLWMSEDKVLGKSFHLQGVFAYHRTTSGKITFQIIGCGMEDLVCKTEKHGTVSAEPYTVSEAKENAEEAIRNVTYYVKGLVGEVIYDPTGEIVTEFDEVSITEAYAIALLLPEGEKSALQYAIKGTIKSIDEEWSSQYANVSFTISDGVNDLKVYRCSVKNGISGSAVAVGNKVVIEGYIQNFYGKPEFVNSSIVYMTSSNSISFTMVDELSEITVLNAVVPESISRGGEEAIIKFLSKVTEGATVSIKGIPAVNDEKVIYASATILDAKPHGQTKEDPLTPEEANAICLTLDLGDNTDDIYFIEGEVTEIVSEYDLSSKRMSYVITVDEVDFVITDSRMGTGVSYEDVVVGVTVIVSSKLLHSTDGGCTTYKNGCQTISVIE